MSEHGRVEAKRGDLALAASSFLDILESYRISETQDVHADIACDQLYFFIAPILGLMWSLLGISEVLLQPVKYGLLIVAYVFALRLVSRSWDMFRRGHFTLGICAQFACVAGQTGIFSFCVNYILENYAGVTRSSVITAKAANDYHFKTGQRR